MACRMPASRQYCGTKISRRRFSRPRTIALAHASSVTTKRRAIGWASSLVCGKPAVATGPGLTVSTRTPSAGAAAPSARDHASAACLDDAYGAERARADRAGDAADVDDAAARGHQAGPQRPGHADHAVVVDVHDPAATAGSTSRAPLRPGTPALQTSRSMRPAAELQQLGAQSEDRVRIADVADVDARLHRQRDRGGLEAVDAAGDQGQPPVALRQPARQRQADAGRAAGDDREGRPPSRHRVRQARHVGFAAWPSRRPRSSSRSPTARCCACSPSARPSCSSRGCCGRSATSSRCCWWPASWRSR